ncbi:unnamed protein product [Musa textilis]
MDEQEEQQLWRRLIDDDYDAAAAFDSQEHPSDAVLVGFVIANIIGLRYYTGAISGRERVGLVREPLNPYDPNAIKVLDTRTVQVGHVERAAAAALAPLLDSCLVSFEAVAPKPPLQEPQPLPPSLPGPPLCPPRRHPRRPCRRVRRRASAHRVR